MDSLDGAEAGFEDGWLEEALGVALLALRDAPSNPRIVVDGPSGSGKTTFATALGERLALPVYNVESWVPGWEGMAEGTRIAEALVAQEKSWYPAWDWQSSSVRGPVPVDLSGGWIVEGCGTLTAVTAEASDLAIWLEAEPQQAKARGLGRDGEMFAPHWERWHEQEVEHWVRDRPRDLADLIIKT